MKRRWPAQIRAGADTQQAITYISSLHARTHARSAMPTRTSVALAATNNCDQPQGV